MDQIARTSNQLGSILRRHRRLAGLSQTQLGEKNRLRQATISAMENGEPGTQLRSVFHVMAALGLEMVIRERSKTGMTIEDLL
ncbi:MAG: helix-turn-helix domain-containing protein [Gammaproteobacteria bacterium]|nr:MAG: helix-turn-helix domain-containing protein [Gammaproteobacteria bacterium]